MKYVIIVLAIAMHLNAIAELHPFSAQDLVMMKRLSDGHLSPDGKRVAYQLRETDYDANKGSNGVWVLDLEKRDGQPRRLTPADVDATAPRWAPDGESVYYLAKDEELKQVWALPIEGGDNPRQVTDLPLDVNTYKLSPDGTHILLSIDVFTDCPDLACTHKRLEASEGKATGRLYQSLFIRHWDTWSDGRRSQLFIGDLGGVEAIDSARRLTVGIDGDVPSKPNGENNEFTFSVDGKQVYFGVRIAGTSEPWSTNFDIYSVPVDGTSPPQNLTPGNPAWDAFPLPSPSGRTLYYLAMKTPAYESDRFAIMALDLDSGEVREVAPAWDRSAGPLQVSADEKTLYTTADDNGDHALFAVDIATGAVKRLVGDGTVGGFDVGKNGILVARQDFRHPTDLFSFLEGQLTQLTAVNAERQKTIEYGDIEWFDFPGWNDETVHGYLVKPVGFEPGKTYPVAFLIHGGPQWAWANDFHYRWNPQIYAGQGYGVVAINFHGSTGYGQKFTDAITQHWGDRPLEDLQKGWAAALERFSFLDGGRACALGASYGGFMINWIAGVWSSPWKCLVNHDGIFDTRMMAYSTEELWFTEHDNGGTPWAVPQNYQEFNPIEYVGEWQTPMLVVHGELDFRIPLEQSIATFTALQRRGIPSEFLVYPDENHFVLKPKNAVLWHDTVNAWLKSWTQN